MAQRHHHYDAAFEDFVRSRGWPYVPVNEQRRAVFGERRVKSFDYLVYPPNRMALLVEIKGRKFPYDGKGGKRFWENWVTLEDLVDLGRWATIFGSGFEPVLVFVYWLVGFHERQPSASVHVFRNRSYAFLRVSAGEYGSVARHRSTQWDTVDVSRPVFRSLVRPLD